MIPLSVITVTLNAEEYIADCLQSLRQQTLAFEHIVVDGGSSDRTVEIVQEQGLPGSVIRSEPDRGLYDAMNKGLGLASGDVIGFLNSDDMYAGPNTLETVVDRFGRGKGEIFGCYGDLVYVDPDDCAKTVRFWRAGPYRPEKIFWGWMVPHPTLFLRKAVYEKYGGFRLDMGTAADYELMVRLFGVHRIPLDYIQEVLVKMRTGGVSNRSLVARLKAHRMDRAAWRVNNLAPYPWTLGLKPLRKLGQWWRWPKLAGKRYG